jgi:hypothetical protein
LTVSFDLTKFSPGRIILSHNLLKADPVRFGTGLSPLMALKGLHIGIKDRIAMGRPSLRGFIPLPGKDAEQVLNLTNIIVTVWGNATRTVSAAHSA